MSDPSLGIECYTTCMIEEKNPGSIGIALEEMGCIRVFEKRIPLLCEVMDGIDALLFGCADEDTRIMGEGTAIVADHSCFLQRGFEFVRKKSPSFSQGGGAIGKGIVEPFEFEGFGAGDGDVHVDGVFFDVAGFFGAVDALGDGSPRFSSGLDIPAKIVFRWSCIEDAGGEVIDPRMEMYGKVMRIELIENASGNR